MDIPPLTRIEIQIDMIMQNYFNRNEDKPMRDVEKMFSNADFSKYTDLKERLAKQLFSSASPEKTIRFSRIEDDDLEFLNAAQGISPEDDPFKKER